MQEIGKKKFSSRVHFINHFLFWVGANPIKVIENLPKKEVLKLARFISANDAPILASALNYSDYLLTLDNEFFNENITALAEKESLIIVKPEELIETLRNNLLET